MARGDRIEDFNTWLQRDNEARSGDREPDVPYDDPLRRLAYDAAVAREDTIFRKGEGLNIGSVGPLNASRNIGTPYSPQATERDRGGGGYFTLSPRDAYNYANEMVDRGTWSYNQALSWINKNNDPVFNLIRDHDEELNHGGGGSWEMTDEGVINYLSKMINAGEMSMDEAKAWIDTFYRRH